MPMSTYKTTTASKMPIKTKTSYDSLKGTFRKASLTAALIIGIIIFSILAIVTAIIVMAHTSDIKASVAEYDYLRAIAGEIEAEYDEHGAIQLSALDEEMRAINPDYVYWIRIDGTGIDYPVVRGSDNEKYLDTTFYGEKLKAGALFMDYRNVGESMPNIIIYGHFLSEGGMFTELHEFLDDEFLENNNVITLIVNGSSIEFEIFSARLTDVNDPAYFLNFDASHSFPRFANRVNAPLRATQIITLSTCVLGNNDDERLIVQGYRLLD
jgi:sortase B